MNIKIRPYEAAATLWILLLVVLIVTPWWPAVVRWMEEDPVGNAVAMISILAASVTVLRGPVFLWDRFIGPYLTRHRQESAAKKNAMDWRIQKCRSLKQAVNHHIEGRVKNYQFDLVGEISGGWGQGPSPELENMMKTYYEKVQEGSKWLEVSKRVLKLVLWETTETCIPKSSDSYVRSSFEGVLIDPLIKGVRVSASWLETEYPHLAENIEKKCDPSENINEFFKRLNDSANNELSLRTLRDKREELISYATGFESALDAERQRLEEELRNL